MEARRKTRSERRSEQAEGNEQQEKMKKRRPWLNPGLELVRRHDHLQIVPVERFGQAVETENLDRSRHDRGMPSSQPRLAITRETRFGPKRDRTRKLLAEPRQPRTIGLASAPRIFAAAIGLDCLVDAASCRRDSVESQIAYSTTLTGCATKVPGSHSR